MKLWAPVYEDKRGNRMLLLNSHYMAETEQEAKDIRLGTMFVECIILRLKVLDVQEFDIENTPHIPGFIEHAGHFPIKIAVIGGPDFDGL